MQAHKAIVVFVNWYHYKGPLILIAVLVELNDFSANIFFLIIPHIVNFNGFVRVRVLYSFRT